MQQVQQTEKRQDLKLAAFFFPNMETVVMGFKAVSTVRKVPIYY